MKKIFNFFKKPKFTILPKVVIAFSSHGCMGNILEFLWIGYVVKSTISDSGTDFYDCQPIILGSRDRRNGEIPLEKAWQIQHLTLNIYIHYI